MKKPFDFVIIDSTPSGLIAAIAAAQHGLQVAVITEDRHPGGMQSSGLGATNFGQPATVGGLTRQFHDRIRDFYIHRYGAGSEQVEACDDGMRFEPHVAEKIYADWLAEVGVTCLYEDPVIHVEKLGNRIVAVTMRSQRRIEGNLFLDASYEGDLMHQAGCSWHAGRESRQIYNESLAGVCFPPSQAGAGDHKLQAYDYRLCLTDNPANQVPFGKPEDYNADAYAWHAAQIRRTPPQVLPGLLPLNMIPNRKTDSRTGEMIGASWDWPHANLQERERIAQRHRRFSAGFIWFLLTDPRIPRNLQEELHRWGHAANEFEDNQYWPYHLYVREARRLAGDFVMTQQDVTNERHKPDAIALGSFYLDVHAVDYAPDPDSPAGLRPEGILGEVDELSLRPYEISYRALLPHLHQCENLLVTTCLSASHIAYSSIRMEPVFMQLGHAAGVAAAISTQEKVSLHQIPIRTLQEVLKAQGQQIDAAPFNDFWPIAKER